MAEIVAKPFVRGSWQLHRGVLQPSSAPRPGSAWWREVNERILRDGCEAVARSGNLPGPVSSPTVDQWMSFVDDPTAPAWYRADNGSVVAAYLAGAELGRAPGRAPDPPPHERSADMGDNEAARKRRRVRWIQRYVVNPPAKVAVWCGMVPGFVLVETTGRRSGKRRRNVVGLQVDGDTGWVVSEHGRHAGYVRNLEADPHVRIRMHRRWCDARACIVDGDDPRARLDSFGRRAHEAAVRRFGTDLLTIRFELRPA